MIDSSLIIAGKTYQSRLLVGSGKCQDPNETKLATEAAEADIITVAIRRTNLGQDNNEPNLLGGSSDLPQ
jgi:thiazole synthase